jgi:hypothetical protein
MVDFREALVARMTQTVRFINSDNRLQKGSLGVQAIVFATNALADLLQQLCGAQYRRVGGFYG